jgi:hypothetical protein
VNNDLPRDVNALDDRAAGRADLARIGQELLDATLDALRLADQHDRRRAGAQRPRAIDGDDRAALPLPTPAGRTPK